MFLPLKDMFMQLVKIINYIIGKFTILILFKNIYIFTKYNKINYIIFIRNYNKNLAHLKILNDGKKDNQEVTEYVVMQDDKKVKISRVFSGKYHAFLLDEENRVYGVSTIIYIYIYNLNSFFKNFIFFFFFFFFFFFSMFYKYLIVWC